LFLAQIAMPLVFSQIPGRHERHLIRMYNNPLFSSSEQQLNSNRLHEAQRLDHEEISDFIERFRKLVNRVVELDPNVESDVLLKIKEELDMAHEEACCMADDQTETKEAINKLVELIMQSVRRGAGNDVTAHEELDQETIAREEHYRLLEYPLIADLLHPKSTIAEHHLARTLLSSSIEENSAALDLFDLPQIESLHVQCTKIIASLDDVSTLANQNIQQISDRMPSAS